MAEGSKAKSQKGVLKYETVVGGRSLEGHLFLMVGMVTYDKVSVYPWEALAWLAPKMELFKSSVSFMLLR